MGAKEEKMLIDLTSTKGITGNEDEARSLFKKYAAPYADEFLYNGLGSIITKNVGDKEGPKVHIFGRMGEVGLMVTRITEKGFLKFQTVGGWWGQVTLAQQVQIKTTTSKVYHGIIGSKPPYALTTEVRNEPYEVADMFIDIGASNDQQVAEWGIHPGDMVAPYTDYRRMNDTKFLLAKAWDNRIGTAVSLKVLGSLAIEGHPNILFAGSDVQEEVGLCGARASTHLVNPDIAFALNTGTAGDTPGMAPKEADSVLGEGPQILTYDAPMIPHKKLRDFVIQVVKKNNIPFQYTVTTGGGTDAGHMHLTRNGIPSLAITVPAKYLHSHTSVIHEDDYFNIVKLVTEVVKRLDKETVTKLTSC